MSAASKRAIALCLATLAVACAKEERPWPPLTRSKSTSWVRTFMQASDLCQRSQQCRRGVKGSKEWVNLFDTFGMKADKKFAKAAKQELSSQEYKEDVAKASLVTVSGEVPAYDDPDVFKLDGPNMTLKRSNKKPIAVMVYGPSAAGKSFSTQKILQRLPPELNADNFITLDGGICRERSRIYGGKDWQRGGAYSRFNGLVQLAHQCGFAGWSDQVESGAVKLVRTKLDMLNFDPLTAKVKKFLKKAAFKANNGAGANVIIPGTLSIKKGIWTYSADKEMERLRQLRKAGYRIVLVFVYASQLECTQQGESREKDEGKKYSNAQWMNSVKSAINVMNRWNNEGGLECGQKMYIVNNRNVQVRDGKVKKTEAECLNEENENECKRCPSGVLEVEEGETLHLAFQNDGVNKEGKPLIRIQQNMKNEGKIKLFAKEKERHDDLGMKPWTQLTQGDPPPGCPPLQGASAPSNDYREPKASDKEDDDDEELYEEETED